MGVERQVREEAALCEGCACCSSCRAEGGSGKSTLLKMGTLSLEWVGWVGLVLPVYCSPDWSCLSAKNSCTGKSILFAFCLSWARGLIPHHLWSLRGETRRECRGTDHGSVTFLVPSSGYDTVTAWSVRIFIPNLVTNFTFFFSTSIAAVIVQNVSLDLVYSLLCFFHFPLEQRGLD